MSRIVFQRHNETPPRINTESLSVTPEATYNVDDDDSDGSDGSDNSESQSIDINAIAIDNNVKTSKKSANSSTIHKKKITTRTTQI